MLYNAPDRGAASARQPRSSAAAVAVVLLAALGTVVSSAPEVGPFTRAFDFFQVAEHQAGSCVPVPSEYEGKTISNLPCANIMVDLPFELKFDGSQIGVPDRSGRSTGMRMYMPSTSRSPAFLPYRITVQESSQRLRLYGLRGNWEWDNRVRNALGVGLPVPNNAIKMEVTC